MKDAGSGESGSRALFCSMEMTIFSRSSGEMCFSFRGPRDSSESSLRSSGRADVGQEWVARSRWLLDESESKLDESSGTSSDAGVLRLDAGGYDEGSDRSCEPCHFTVRMTLKKVPNLSEDLQHHLCMISMSRYHVNSSEVCGSGTEANL